MNVFDLWAKISLDTSDYDNELDDAEKKANSFGDRLKNGLATAAKVGTAAITAASAAIGVLTKKSIDGYGEYEQLVGGVETLFKDSADVVMGYANNAYKTAGLSANEYMETVTSFSASLLQSLDGDTKKAAETADLAITDMADNANKMGTAMESIQNAYQGFAKQNYTMLDNLKLGYGGTKEEMQRLLSDAEKLSGQKFDLSSYADIVEAIHVVQTEMGITGTTAKEASVTIQGSMNAAKSAWENLIVGIADENANLEELVGNFVDSVATAGENIIPRVEQILVGMGQAIQTLAPIIAEQVPDLVASVLPSLVSAGAQLLVGLTTGLVGAVPELVAAVPGIVKSTADAVISNLPAIQKAGQELLSMFTDGIFSKLPDMLDKLPDIIDGFLDFITDNLPDVLNKGVEMLNEFVTGVINGIPDMLSRIPQIITSFVKFVVDNLPVIVEAGMSILANLVTGIIDNLPEIGKAVGQIIGAVVTGVGDLLGSVIDVGKNIVSGLWEGITSKAEWIKEKVTGFFGGIVDGVKGFLGIHSPSTLFREQVGQYIGLGVVAGIEDTEDKATKAANDMAKKVYNTSKEWADRQTKYMNLSYGEQAELWETIQSQFVEGSEQYLDAEEKVFDLRKKQVEEQVKAEEEALKEREKAQEEYAKKVEDINKKISDLEENYQKELSSRTQEIFNSYSLFDAIPERQKKSGDELISNLSGQISAIEEFYGGLDELAERGVGEGLIEELRGMGPSAIDELSALLSLSDEKLTEYANLFAEKQALANSIATEELSGLRDETDAKIMEQLQSANALYDEYAPEVGFNFTNLMASGIEEGTGAVVDASVAAAQAAMDAFNQVLEDYGFSAIDLAALGAGAVVSGASNSSNASIPAPNTQYPTAPAGDIVIPITLELDGEVLVQKTYRLYQNEASRVGPAMVRV